MSKFAVVEKQFEYKGHDCICIFGCRGYRCGYVSVDDNKEFNEYDIECHCGLSFSGTLPYDYGQKETYYIGFDCGHICDGNDYNLALKYGLLTEQRFNELLEMQIHLPTFLEPVRSLEYVENECKKIVDQLEAEMNTNENKFYNLLNDIYRKFKTGEYVKIPSMRKIGESKWVVYFYENGLIHNGVYYDEDRAKRKLEQVNGG